MAGSLIAITARALTHPERRVYQQASGDSNPFYAPRSVELVGLYRRKHFRDKETGSALLNDVKSRLEPQPVSKRSFLTRSAPLFAHRRAHAPPGHRGARPTLGRAARLGDAGAGEGAAGAGGGAGPLALDADRAVPPLPLGEPLRLPLRQHPVALRGDGPGGRGEDPLGPAGHRLAPVLPRGPPAGAGEVGLPRAGGGAREAQGHPRPPRPARAVRRRGARLPAPGRLPAGGGRTRGALHLRRGAPLGGAGGRASCSGAG